MSDSPANGEEQGGVQGDPGGEPVLGQVCPPPLSSCYK